MAIPTDDTVEMATACMALNLAYAPMRNLVLSGAVEAEKIAGRFRISRRSLERYAAERRKVK